MTKKHHETEAGAEHEEMVPTGEPFSPEIKPDQPDHAGSSAGNEIQQLQAELAESKDKFLRLYSEFDNFRKRSQREKLDLLKTAGEDVIRGLLPVLDDFERARAALSAEQQGDHGLLLVATKLQHILEQKGLKKMESIGTPFNEELHEAISMVGAADEAQRGLVTDEAECGYFLNGKVIRHAKVIVAQ